MTRADTGGEAALWLVTALPALAGPGSEFDPRKLKLTPSDQFFPPAANLSNRRLPSHTAPTMSALRILVPVKRVIDYAVRPPALHEPRAKLARRDAGDARHLRHPRRPRSEPSSLGPRSAVLTTPAYRSSPA